MREIKFRAWIEESKSMEVGLFGLRSDGKASFNKEAILLQFTGLKDKNGVEIYEGDILNAGESIVRIQFSGRGFEGVYLNLSELYDAPLQNNNYLHWSIIGNIHENPEIL